MSVPKAKGLSKLKKKHFRVKHQKVKLFRASEPLLSVFMWGVNHTVSSIHSISLFLSIPSPCFLSPISFQFLRFCNEKKPYSDFVRLSQDLSKIGEFEGLYMDSVWIRLSLSLVKCLSLKHRLVQCDSNMIDMGPQTVVRKCTPKNFTLVRGYSRSWANPRPEMHAQESYSCQRILYSRSWASQSARAKADRPQNPHVIQS